MPAEQVFSIAHVAFGDLEGELANTRKILERVPGDKLAWKPHEKSKSLGELAQHIANIPRLLNIALLENELDPRARPQQAPPTSTQDIVDLFDQQAEAAREAVKQITPDLLMQDWSLKVGGKVFMTMKKYAAARTFALSHLIHHRGSLVVYLRLLDVAVPGMYGPSADEPIQM